jgi:hypothetical protein
MPPSDDGAVRFPLPPRHSMGMRCLRNLERIGKPNSPLFRASSAGSGRADGFLPILRRQTDADPRPPPGAEQRSRHRPLGWRAQASGCVAADESPGCPNTVGIYDHDSPPKPRDSPLSPAHHSSGLTVTARRTGWSRPPRGAGIKWPVPYVATPLGGCVFIDRQSIMGAGRIPSQPRHHHPAPSPEHGRIGAHFTQLSHYTFRNAQRSRTHKVQLPASASAWR